MTTDTTVIKKTPHMIATHWEPPKKKAIKPLAPEMAIRRKNALNRMLEDGDISKAEFDALWAKTLERLKAGV
jgi:membrane peptidoglycan carboxypeptidase